MDIYPTISYYIHFGSVWKFQIKQECGAFFSDNSVRYGFHAWSFDYTVNTCEHRKACTR